MAFKIKSEKEREEWWGWEEGEIETERRKVETETERGNLTNGFFHLQRELPSHSAEYFSNLIP